MKYITEFYNENNARVDHMHIERTEQLQVERFIQSDSIVLELGARVAVYSEYSQSLRNYD